MQTNKPHLLFINQHYWPDNAATALALTDLAEFVAKKGYRVSVLASRHLYDHSGEELPAFEQKNGVDIYRLNQSNYGRHSHKGRLMDYATFFVRALFKSLSIPADCVITLTTPPLLGSIGWIHTMLKSSRFVYWSMDLHPEAEIAAGLLPQDSAISRWFKRFHEKVLHSAHAVVTLSSSMTSRVLNYGLPKNKIHQISIWSDEHEIKPESPNNNADFIVHYSGNLGLAHHFECLLGVMILAQDYSDLQFVFTGGGPQMPVLKERVLALHLKNVQFLPYVDRADLSISLGKASVQWFSLAPEFEGIAYPSKLIGYMASGRPIVFLGGANSDSAMLIKNAECGFGFEIHESHRVLDVLLQLKANPELTQTMGKNARAYFEKHLTKHVCCSQWENVIESVCS